MESNRSLLEIAADLRRLSEMLRNKCVDFENEKPNEPSQKEGQGGNIPCPSRYQEGDGGAGQPPGA